MPLTGKALAEMRSQQQQPEVAQVGRSFSNVQAQVSPSRPKTARIFRLQPQATEAQVEQVLQAAYCQVLDLWSADVPHELRSPELDSQLHAGKISVREFVQALVNEPTYRRRFFAPYPNQKVVELLFRHLLGRTPVNAESAELERLLTEQGLEAAATALINSSEYNRFFGENVVPYQRFSSK
ncbi:MAG: phycobilisome rod-core linker polypeptide [Oscillatoria sp. PMC 1068.18]|nr:phycobilisome rod-core linker polypeptide [Oscillatoria sp. PMC 1076.18]MEC4987875.1 phycobilisome rod-core linker polypeptide [Oscillatoria sp. PMC 1068.18]